MATRRSPSGTIAKQVLAKRKSTRAQRTVSPVEEGVPPTTDADVAHASMAGRAHALYEERRYRQGCDLQDWLEAQRHVLEEQRP